MSPLIRGSLLALAFGALGTLAPAGAQTPAINVQASTTFAPLLREVAQAYTAQRPDITVNVSNIGSVAAANAVQAGTADIAFVDSAPPAGSVLYSRDVFALPLAIVVSPQAGVTALKRAEIAGLFGGGYTSWKELGGADLPVRVFTRPPQGAMSAAFANIFGAVPKSGEVLASSPEVVSAVRGAPGAIGFTTLAAARDANLPVVAIDGRSPTSGLGPAGYPFFAFGYVVTSGPPTRELSRFLAFVETRRPLLAKYGIVSVRDLVR